MSNSIPKDGPQLRAVFSSIEPEMNEVQPGRLEAGVCYIDTNTDPNAPPQAAQKSRMPIFVQAVADLDTAMAAAAKDKARDYLFFRTPGGQDVALVSGELDGIGTPLPMAGLPDAGEIVFKNVDGNAPAVVAKIMGSVDNWQGGDFRDLVNSVWKGLGVASAAVEPTMIFASVWVSGTLIAKTNEEFVEWCNQGPGPSPFLGEAVELTTKGQADMINALDRNAPGALPKPKK